MSSAIPAGADDKAPVAGEQTLKDALVVAEWDRFFGALRAIGPGVVVVVHDAESRKQWRKVFKQAVKRGVLHKPPLIRVDASVPEGSIQIQDVDDRPDEVEEAVDAASAQGVQPSGLILP